MQGRGVNLPPGKVQDEEPAAFCASILSAQSKVMLAAICLTGAERVEVASA